MVLHNCYQWNGRDRRGSQELRTVCIYIMWQFSPTSQHGIYVAELANYFAILPMPHFLYMAILANYFASFATYKTCTKLADYFARFTFSCNIQDVNTDGYIKIISVVKCSLPFPSFCPHYVVFRVILYCRGEKKGISGLPGELYFSHAVNFKHRFFLVGLL